MPVDVGGCGAAGCCMWLGKSIKTSTYIKQKGFGRIDGTHSECNYE